MAEPASPRLVVLGFEPELAGELASALPGALGLALAELRGCRLACDAPAASILRRHLGRLPGRLIAMLGPGEYHHVSRLLLERLREPCALVLFDHHSDGSGAGWGEEALRCDAWVPRPGEVAGVVRVAWVGVGAESFGDPDCAWGTHGCVLPASEAEWALFARRGRGVGDGALLDPVERVGGSASGRALDAWLGDLPVYVSIDKDVLSTADAATGWSHGTLRLAELTAILHGLLERRRLVGADITGELGDAPTRVLDPTWRAGRRRNLAANAQLVELLCRYLR